MPLSTNLPFSNFAPPIHMQTNLRRAITAAYRRDEAQCLASLLEAAKLTPRQKEAIAATAQNLITSLRAKRGSTGVESLIQEYSLSSQEGIALMCLAEALLRIPDQPTRDALIRDKIADGNWTGHLGSDKPLFVNAATWGLVVTGKLTSTANDKGLAASLTRLIARAGEPIVRRGVDLAMRLMGEQFVTGETIDEALRRAHPMEQRGYCYSYDMLGEAATTATDAERYFASYETAIHAIGHAAGRRGLYDGPGISIKLSALHPRYSRSQADRVMAELLPRVKTLAVLAKSYNIGLNIDAEEADRLELSLDLLEALAHDPALAVWNGLGFVVQAYGKRCPFVLDYIVDLARRSNRRIMVRLVKGAYWDAEIKRAQVDGLDGFPVFTRKIHTDVSYLACARKLLAAKEYIFPQFATHNAQSLASIYHMAGKAFEVGDYEFQCLHGMGEALYNEVVGPEKLNRPCRIYAPVGTHETLLAYLVRRLLENGANSSFVNRIGDATIAVSALIVDPADEVQAMASPGAGHEHISLPSHLFAPVRHNSAGLDLSNEDTLHHLAQALSQTALAMPAAFPLGAEKLEKRHTRDVSNPANRRDKVGSVAEALEEDVTQAAQQAANKASAWANQPVTERAACLERAASSIEQQTMTLMGLIMREAGKSAASAVNEVREAVDFLRYYAAEARRTLTPQNRPLGPVVCISPWNFPLAIFTGQIAAALVAGNTVLAKPAEETPLIAARAISILHEAGIPQAVLQFLPGDGKIGAALVAAPETQAVMFTGSTEVARLIQLELSKRTGPGGKPIPFIAETGGQNVMIVDSSALAEQVVADVIASAFDSAGQRCSALRVLCLQDDIADRVLAMIKGAMHELRIGNTDALATDIGPVITAEAANTITAHVERLRNLGNAVFQRPLPASTAAGSFVAPTIIEISSVADIGRECFGPVLHVMRFKRPDIGALIDAVNATGYGLTFGLHTRLDEMIRFVTSRIRAGNIYINRNIIGAVVGVQPFGGRGLSGTGPKAGGPLYLGRLVQHAPLSLAMPDKKSNPALTAFVEWLNRKGETAAANAAHDAGKKSLVGYAAELPGPVGETNQYTLHPRGNILLLPETPGGLFMQLASVLATGNTATICAEAALLSVVRDIPANVAQHVKLLHKGLEDHSYSGALIEGGPARVQDCLRRLAAFPGPLILSQAASGLEPFALNLLIEEIVTSTNTTAAGGNASLMTIG
jgi:RHH-type transcriptional regulator, proline utilization regulon repressor / proline dehydrogenase / delta 1-pyrroline-5-carboxylate dehydrogenase